MVGDTSGLNNVQKAYLDEYNKKLIELKSTLLQLLPEWEKIFGDKEQRSFSDLKEAERIAREIKNNAKVSYDSDGKPNGFTSFFTKDDGSIENVKGAYSLLDKLIKAIPQLQDAQLAVNPFKTLAKNVKELFTSEKTATNWKRKSDGWEKVPLKVLILSAILQDRCLPCSMLWAMRVWPTRWVMCRMPCLL